MTRGLADSYRAELVRAAREGLAFDPASGERVLWAAPEPVSITWYQHAVAYVDMKWLHLAAHSRASVAEALATLTPALTRPTARRPPIRTLRAALYGHAFNPPRRRGALDPAEATALIWLERASLPHLQDPQVTRRPGRPGATAQWHPSCPAHYRPQRAVFHNALGYAIELGLLPGNPLGHVSWKAAVADSAVNPQTVASPVQVRAILAEVSRIRPELTAFFGCLYYAALRPEEAVVLRHGDLVLTPHGWGKVILTAACPRTGAAWTSTGTSHELRGLQHRPDGAIRTVRIPPVLAVLLSQHLRRYGTTPDGRLFRGTRGGMLSKASTAAPGTPPSTPLLARPWPPPAWPAAPMTCGGSLVAVAERKRLTRRDRRPRREQRPRPANRLHPLHQRPGRCR